MPEAGFDERLTRLVGFFPGHENLSLQDRDLGGFGVGFPGLNEGGLDGRPVRLLLFGRQIEVLSDQESGLQDPARCRCVGEVHQLPRLFDGGVDAAQAGQGDGLGIADGQIERIAANGPAIDFQLAIHRAHVFVARAEQQVGLDGQFGGLHKGRLKGLQLEGGLRPFALDEGQAGLQVIGIDTRHLQLRQLVDDLADFLAPAFLDQQLPECEEQDFPFRRHLESAAQDGDRLLGAVVGALHAGQGLVHTGVLGMVLDALLQKLASGLEIALLSGQVRGEQERFGFLRRQPPRVGGIFLRLGQFVGTVGRTEIGEAELLAVGGPLQVRAVGAFVFGHYVFSIIRVFYHQLVGIVRIFEPSPEQQGAAHVTADALGIQVDSVAIKFVRFGVLGLDFVALTEQLRHFGVLREGRFENLQVR